MSGITVPVSVPGASQSTQELLAAAKAATELSTRLNAEKMAQVVAAGARREAAAATRAASQAARESARELVAAERAVAQASREAAAAAKQANDYRAASEKRATQEFIQEQRTRAQVATGYTPSGFGGNASMAAGRAKNFITGDRVAAIANVAGSSIPGLGPVAGALASGSTIAPVFAALVAAVGLVGWAMGKAAQKAQEAAEGFAAAVSANDRREKAQAAADQSGLSVFERTRKNALLTAGRSGDAGIARAQAISRTENITIDEALATTAQGLDGNATKAAILASKTLGIGIAEASDQIAAGKLKGSPEQIVAMLSKGKLSAKQVAGRASKLATSSYGVYGAAIDQASAESSLDEFSLVPRALQGARNRGQGFRDAADVPGSTAREIDEDYKRRIGSTSDKEEQRKLEEQRARAVAEVAPGQKVIMGAAR